MATTGFVERARRTLWAPDRRRITVFATLGIVGVVLAAALVASVGKVDKDEAVVYFPLQPTAEQVKTVRADCPGFGRAILEPPDTNHLASSLRYPIRYDITNAPPKDKAALYECLHTQNVNVSEFRGEG